VWCSVLEAQSPLDQARALYQKTDYAGALAALRQAPPDAAALQLKGQALFHSGQFSEAVKAFEQRTIQSPRDSPAWHWLGRALGRQAESGNPLRAPFLAGKARAAFEKAVELDASNMPAVTDLFTYYVEAPAFLGGGHDKAERLAREMIQPRDEAEFQSALAQLAIAAKRFDQAEAALRKAAEAAPRNPAKLEELAVFLSRRGKHAESDQVFRRARELQPGRPAWLFARAQALTETRRLPGEARTLLEAYLAAPRTPDDPSAGEARRLLDQLPSSARNRP
jgi:Flp pilus assembly protein TadD